MSKQRKSAPAARGMYAILRKRLFKAVTAARNADDSTHQLNNLLLRRASDRLHLVASDGHCLVAIDAPADRTLFTEGQKAILPRELINALVKTKGSAKDDIEIVDEGRHVSAHMANGTVITADAAKSKFYPNVQPLLDRTEADATIELSPKVLQTLLKAVLAACPGADRITFHVAQGSTTMRITASDDEVRIAAVVAGVESVLPGTEEEAKTEAVAHG